MARHFTHRRGYVRPSYTHADRQRSQSNSGAATAAVVVPVALVAAGILLWRRSQVPAVIQHDPNALPGMSGFGSKLKKAVKKVAKVATKVDPVAITVHKTKRLVDTAIKNPKDFTGIAKQAAKFAPSSAVFGPLVKKMTKRGQPKNTTRPEPGQPVVYQDVDGRTITEAEYRALDQAVNSGSPIQLGDHWAMPTGRMITAAAYAALFPGTSGTASTGGGLPVASGSGTSYTSIYEPSGHAPNDPAGGGGPGPSSYELPREAPVVQQYAPAAADAPVAAPSKFNPLIAVGALIAVPVVMGLTGGK